MSLSYEFNEKLWLYNGDGAWYFITLPAEYAEEIKLVSSPFKRGFGSIKVLATIGATTWATSIFPDNKSESYLLPIKKQIRLSHNIQHGDTVKVAITIVGIK